MRRRVNLVAFNVKPASPDPELEAKLRAESGRFLAWCIEGCLEWQREGLAAPAAVRIATDEYFEEQDTFGEWLRTCCEAVPDARASPTELFDSWAAFSNHMKEMSGDRKSFAAKLKARGFEPGKSRGLREYRGIRIIPNINAVKR